MNEQIWRRAERFLASRERVRLIRNKTIVPAYQMKPQMMVKNPDGSWSPEIKRYG